MFNLGNISTKSFQIKNLFNSNNLMNIVMASLSSSKTLETLNFDNLALKTLPIDTIEENYVREVRNACFSRVKPTPVTNPKFIVFSKSALKLIDLKEEEIERSDAADFFGGNKIIPGSDYAAHCYCGHQFGHFSGQLGDGATMYIGEIINSKNERWEIQFKGAGKTPYSRTADGRKVLRSSLREFLCSEAIHNLGIATTRAGTCVTSDSTVIRDILYDGNPILEKCTIITRIAPSFIRFGSFEICKPTDRLTGRKGPSFANPEIIGKLLDYVVDTFYTEIALKHKSAESKEDKYFDFFSELVRRTAILVADWQCTGWCHGVLNTDNMSILGLTIDYGPFGFLDRYDPDHICNGSDNSGRYSYRSQPSICQWNCSKLAEVIKDYLPISRAKQALLKFEEIFNQHYLDKMRKKLGLFLNIESDTELIEDFLQTMFDTGADFTNSFRNLNKLTSLKDNENENLVEILMSSCISLDELKEFNKPKYPKETLLKLANLINSDQEYILQFMGFSANLVASELEKLQKYEELQKLTNEEKRRKDRDLWAKWVKKYTDRTLIDSKAHGNEDEYFKKRTILMNSNNPRFILRNHIVQNVIEKAEKNEFTDARALLKLLENPYSEESIENLLSEYFKGQCINWEVKSKFYENPPTNESARIVVT